MAISMTKIRKFKTENYVERLFCDCGTELIYQFDFWGILDVYTKNAQYKYICPNCGKEILEKEIYPKTIVDYVEVE